MKIYLSAYKSGADMKDEIMTIKDLTIYLRINEKTIYKPAKQGKLPGIKTGGVWR